MKASNEWPDVITNYGVDKNHPFGQKFETVGHAHWLYDPNANDWGIGGWCCSHCHYKNDNIGISEHPNIPILAIAGTRYCGNCGFRMDEVVEDENH